MTQTQKGYFGSPDAQMSLQAGGFLQPSSTVDSALFFVVAAFVLNVIVVIIAFCYFDPTPHEPALMTRTYHTIRRLSTRGERNTAKMTTSESPSNSTVLFV